MVIEKVMKHIRNFFEVGYVDGDFEITANGEILPSDGLNGQYIAIEGSTYNNGVHVLNDDKSIECEHAERFTGRVWILHPPKAFVELCEQIEEYNKKTPVSAFVSESFGGWSGTRATGSHGVMTWHDAFANELSDYRKMFTEVDV